MGGYDRLMDRIANGERILIDGATGTEIERRGVPQLENARNGGGAGGLVSRFMSIIEPKLCRNLNAGELCLSCVRGCPLYPQKQTLERVSLNVRF